MSTAVDMFLRQVALTGGIPFKVALPEAPRSVDVNAMTDEELSDALATGLQEVLDGKSKGARDAFSEMREGLLGE